MKNIKALIKLNREILEAGTACGHASVCDICAGQMFPDPKKYETLIAAAEQDLKDIEENR